MNAYFANWGPKTGPLLSRDHPPCMGIFTEPFAKPAPDPVGIAYPVGWISYKRVIAATFRLVIRKEELEGRWVCDGRRFVQLGDADTVLFGVQPE